LLLGIFSIPGYKKYNYLFNPTYYSVFIYFGADAFPILPVSSAVVGHSPEEVVLIGRDMTQWMQPLNVEDQSATTIDIDPGNRLPLIPGPSTVRQQTALDKAIDRAQHDVQRRREAALEAKRQATAYGVSVILIFIFIA
jgi:hypothetical protein